MGLGLKVHVGHVLDLKHDLSLGVDPSYKPCWDHIRTELESPIIEGGVNMKTRGVVGSRNIPFQK